jgi:hypothetical protein
LRSFSHVDPGFFSVFSSPLRSAALSVLRDVGVLLWSRTSTRPEAKVARLSHSTIQLVFAVFCALHSILPLCDVVFFFFLLFLPCLPCFLPPSSSCWFEAHTLTTCSIAWVCVGCVGSSHPASEKNSNKHFSDTHRPRNMGAFRPRSVCTFSLRLFVGDETQRARSRPMVIVFPPHPSPP